MKQKSKNIKEISFYLSDVQSKDVVTTDGSSIQLSCVIEPGDLVLKTAYWTFNNEKITNNTVQMST